MGPPPASGIRPTTGAAAVAAALVAFGRELESQGAAQVGSSFTARPEVDALLREDPNAFLLGVLFTQGIPAERAWAGPWELRERLGHFELERLAGEPDAVLEVFQRPPMLHRFKNTVPRWVSSAAARLIADWHGDASQMWTPGTHVLEVSERLSGFDGIGRKKSVMAVQILIRHFGVDLRGAEHGQVAYDVQVRRVFLRSGLAFEDTVEAIETAARDACPESPGTLDLAAWLIGRQWCRPRNPLCDDCRIGAVCARRVWLTPEGVGKPARS